VNQHKSDHEIGAPTVEGAYEPAEGLLVIQHLQTGPSLSGGWNVHECETDAGDELQNHHGEAGAAEDVGPARGASGHRMFHRFFDRLAHFEPEIKPLHQVFGQAHANLLG
jgi:hypothetical protein